MATAPTATASTKPLTAAWETLVYHPVRAAYANCKKRFVGAVAGRGSGKTALAKRKLVTACAMPKPWKDPRYFYAAPTFDQAKLIAWNDLIALMPSDWIADLRVGSGEIKTVYGSTIHMVGVDIFRSRQRTKVEGQQWDGGIVDESSDCPPGVFALSIMGALSARRGWCHRIGIPKRNGVGAAEFREWTSTNGPDRESFSWESEDIMRILDPERLAYARENMDPRDYEEQFGAKWINAGGAVFHSFTESANVRPCSYNTAIPIIVGMDFNTDPMCWVFGHHYREQRRFEWFDELWMRSTNTIDALNMAWRRYGSHRAAFHFYLDASSGQRKTSSTTTDYKIVANDERFKTAGRIMAFPMMQASGHLQANPQISDRFAACNALFAHDRMHVDPRCKRLIGDLLARYEKPGDQGDMGHITDAMGYPVHAVYPYGLILNRVTSTVIAMPGAN